jgi:sporulation protein YlmC with PRC-barrel domain
MASVDNPSDTDGRLIAASKVNGTAVYNASGENLGSIYDVMLNKTSGTADYAIMSFGGFLGMGERYHPIPWAQLTYNPDVGGYVVNLDRDRLEGAPNYAEGDVREWDERRTTDVDNYYGTGTAHGGDLGLASPGLGLTGSVW